MFHQVVVAFLCFSGRDVSDGLEKSSGVEPVDPFEGSELDRLEGAPWAPPVDDFSLVKAIDGLGQSVVVAVSDTANRGLNTGLGQPFCILD